MNEADKIKYQRLRDTFERNFKITNLFSSLLTLYPEIITAEMVETLTEDGRISKEEAIVALLGEIFGLDFDNPDHRPLIRDYLTPSVRLLDAKKYENDPYYKNIPLKDIKDGNWEIRMEEYPPYKAVICHDMIINDDLSEIPPLGFFTEKFSFPAILEDGNEWMTLTPVDLDTCEEAIAEAKGRVVTFGLGLGYYAYMASEKEEVESVTVVELSPKVISLFKEHILPKMPNRHKINIVNMDAFRYAREVMPKENFDLAFVDTWRDASDGAPMYRKIKELEPLSPNTKFLYWIENFLISRIRAENFVTIDEKIESGELKDVSYSQILKMIKEIC